MKYFRMVNDDIVLHQLIKQLLISKVIHMRHLHTEYITKDSSYYCIISYFRGIQCFVCFFTIPLSAIIVLLLLHSSTGI